MHEIQRLNFNNDIQQNNQNITNDSQFLNVVKNDSQAVVINEPFLPKLNEAFKFTLILDLDETMVHFIETSSGGHFLIRPYSEKFLKEISKMYEIVIFTAAQQEYANWVIDSIDKYKCVQHRLFRSHTVFDGAFYIKDLNKLGRDLGKTIIVDNVAENFKLQFQNGIAIKSWFSDAKDTALNDLIPLLQEIYQSQTNDVRQMLKKLRDKYNPQKVKNNFFLPR